MLTFTTVWSTSSSGEKTRAAVPSDQIRVRYSIRLPPSRSSSRLLASGGRKTYRYSRSRPGATSALAVVRAHDCPGVDAVPTAHRIAWRKLVPTTAVDIVPSRFPSPAHPQRHAPRHRRRLQRELTGAVVRHFAARRVVGLRVDGRQSAPQAGAEWRQRLLSELACLSVRPDRLGPRKPQSWPAVRPG